ncbi:MAG TPA: hypothetical protein VJH92_03740 [Candidatus Nanoarchaeia archaeon]|nr:hypothetical protein [Candidatus Nanoarchaeia archaeon]
MVNHVQKCTKIVDGLIKRNFPVLGEKKIVVLEFAYRKFTASVFDFSFITLIFIDPKKIAAYSYNELKGLFAHELGHIERHSKRSFYEKFSFIIRYLFNTNVRIEEERETDNLAIRKGYAKNLYALVKRVEKMSTREHLRYMFSKGYLSSNKIKSYAKKIGKWR